MKNFEFCLPTKVVFGRGAQEQVGRLAAQWGRHVLILYGSQRVKSSGLMGQLTGLLDAEGVAWETHGGIQANPLLSEAEQICRIVKEKGIDLLLAVGGGSVIDTAKAVSIGSCNPGELWDYYTGKLVPDKAMPIGVVLTMAATASEANCTSVISNEAMGKKVALACPLTSPVFALLNPELTYTVPSKQTAVGALDIFSHSFERYFHLEQKGVLRNLLCSAVMKTVVQVLPKVQSEPEDYDGRAQLMWAATMAHSDMIGTEGVFACHAMSHVLTEEFQMSHGGGLAILMLAWCKYVAKSHPEEVAEFARDVWNVSPKEGSAAEIAREGIVRFQNFVSQSGLPVTLREAGISDIDSGRLAKLTLDGEEFIGENFCRLYEKDLETIFEIAI